jgi:LysR family transcriptional regulator for metE and metH
MIERSHLEIVREVGRRGTLTQAADVLHLSQSALSHSVRKLEQQAGTRIWKKQGRRLEFTEAGKFLHDLARRLLPQLEHAEATLSRFAIGKKGILRIGMECHPCYQWLLKVVLPYLQQWPEVDMDLKKDFQFDGIKALIHHEIDLLITPDPHDDDTLQFTPAFAYEMMLIVDRKHPLAKRSYVTPPDLKNERLLTYPVEKQRLDIFRNFLSPANCLPRAHQIIEDSDIMIQMVAAGRGITALPDWLARNYIETLPIKALRLGATGLHKKLFTVIRNTDLDLDYIAAFVRYTSKVS